MSVTVRDFLRSSLRRTLLFPFHLLDRVKVNGESLLWHCVNGALSEKAKLRMSRQTFIDLVGRKSPEQRFKVGSYLNAFNDDSLLADKFASNLISKFPLFESQLGQDCLVDTVFDGKTNGIFVEIGVGNGKDISNTYFLEKYRDWTGLLCEPALRFHDSIRQDREATLVDRAVYDQSDLELEFSEVIGQPELSTLSNRVLADGHDRSQVVKYTVKTISFNDLYDEYLDGKTIDYLSVDTEGSELAILGSIDFDKIRISMISTEHNYDAKKLEEISRLLGRFDYVEILPSIFEFESIFVKRGIVGQ